MTISGKGQLAGRAAIASLCLNLFRVGMMAAAGCMMDGRMVGRAWRLHGWFRGYNDGRGGSGMMPPPDDLPPGGAHTW